MVLDIPTNLMSAQVWWEQRRLRYNIGLIVAGLLAFVAYVAVVDEGISIGTMPGAEITLFTTVFQGGMYLFMIAIANVCYGLGQWSEAIVRPKDVGRYRRTTYQLGFWFFHPAAVFDSCLDSLVVPYSSGHNSLAEPITLDKSLLTT